MILPSVSQSGLYFRKFFKAQRTTSWTDPPSVHSMQQPLCLEPQDAQGTCLRPSPAPASPAQPALELLHLGSRQKTKKWAWVTPRIQAEKPVGWRLFPMSLLDAAAHQGHSMPRPQGFRRLPWGGPARAPVSSWAFQSRYRS